MWSKLNPNYLIENRNREPKYTVSLLIAILEVGYQINRSSL